MYGACSFFTEFIHISHLLIAYYASFIVSNCYESLKKGFINIKGKSGMVK